VARVTGAIVVAGTGIHLTDFSHTAFVATVAAMPETFRTKDVSTHSRMTQAHPELVQERNYHACVGRYLSMYRSDLGLTLVDDFQHPQGALWQRR
jgi:hypothetical protein